MGLLTKIFGSHSDRELKKVRPIADSVTALESEYRELMDSELTAKTQEFRARLELGETLDDILPEAFATAREAAARVLGMRPFYVQIIGAVVLHQGRVAEMKTGEGKTLVAVLPAYLNALLGNGVHIVTVNDYLARRDSEWMGKVYRFLGLSVGLIVHGLNSDERRLAYAADITYGTNNELGFDYLRDNMALYKADMVQRGHPFAIVDEVDSILIDEARTPLIISGQGEESTEMYQKVDAFVSRLRRVTYASVDEKAEDDDTIDADYIVDEKARTATLTAQGTAKAEAAFGLENLADIENSTTAHHINQAIKAHGVMKRDIDYVVQEDGSVIIVDEFTGRLMIGRRYNEGLHQAIEAKEHVTVERESKTLATITFQNYFRLYGKLSGMTGTALTEQEEFLAIYNLDIVEIPTNKPNQRGDESDSVYKNDNGKNAAIIAQIEECNERGQPVLVGTVTIEKSEFISALLKKRGLTHNVLNAKQHDREAEIVAQAGKFGAVTIATNMAGRGTDIMLGGNPEYLAKADLKREGFSDETIVEATGFAETGDEEILAARASYSKHLGEHKAVTDEEAERVRSVGGLFILGTERHESRRIDNQLRGRAGRQGDPGASRFYLALTDDIMRKFGSERIMNMMESLGMEEDTPIEHKMLTGAIEQAQKTVESQNFQSRKGVLEYDDIMNIQRNLIYEQRRRVLDGEDISDYVQSTMEEVAAQNAEDPFFENALERYAKKAAELGNLKNGAPLIRELERVVLLRVVDEYWMEHIDAMHELRRGINLRAYGNTEPLDAYKNEGYEMFETMVEGIKEELVRRLLTVQVRTDEQLQRRSAVRNQAENVGGEAPQKRKPIRKAKKVGRNDPCPCGKWKDDGSRPLKYKECCGA